MSLYASARAVGAVVVDSIAATPNAPTVAARPINTPPRDLMSPCMAVISVRWTPARATQCTGGRPPRIGNLPYFLRESHVALSTSLCRGTPRSPAPKARNLAMMSPMELWRRSSSAEPQNKAIISAMRPEVASKVVGMAKSPNGVTKLSEMTFGPVDEMRSEYTGLEAAPVVSDVDH